MTSKAQWRAMLRRCENPQDLNYRRYGARGISVCERWHDYGTYVADIHRLIGPVPPGKSLDRIDNDGNYEPGNVRWATHAEQMRNSRAIGPRPYRPRPRRPQPLQHRPLLRPAEVREVLNVSRDALGRLIRAGELRAINISTGSQPRYRISELALEEFIAQRLPAGMP